MHWLSSSETRKFTNAGVTTYHDTHPPPSIYHNTSMPQLGGSGDEAKRGSAGFLLRRKANSCHVYNSLPKYSKKAARTIHGTMNRQAVIKLDKASDPKIKRKISIMISKAPL